jgi:redox-sensitive bicupin YhaK (pirin superfamily)
VPTYRNAFAYVFAGSGSFSNASPPRAIQTDQIVGATIKTLAAEEVEDRSLVVFDSGDEVRVQAGERGIRFLLVSGKPLREPVAWHGPIVMNTREELQQAFEEYQAGKFLKHTG